MKQVWKYPLHGLSEQRLTVPNGACPLTVQMQDETPMMWVLVDPARSPSTLLVYVYGTGHDVTHEGTYIGTFQLPNAPLVFHVFARGVA